LSEAPLYDPRKDKTKDNKEDETNPFRGR